MSPADVTICIPTFNQSKYLLESVKSALNQTVPAISILVSDDASTDETNDLMKEFAANEPQVRYERNSNNFGIAGNNSKAMSQAQSEFIVRLDSDDLLEPQYIETLHSLMLRYPQAGYGHVAIQQIDQTGLPLDRVFLNRRTGYQDSETALKAAVRGYRVASNIVMYRQAAVKQMDFFNGRPEFVEDYDMAARLAAAGWGNVYCEQILAKYRIWTDAGGIRARRKHLQLSGYCRIFDEVLQPAFASRYWSEAPLRRQRRHLALTHSNACFLPPHDAHDRKKLLPLLRQLGGGIALELKLFVLRMGFAGAFESAYKIRGRLKLFVKRTLALVRPLFAVPKSFSAEQPH